MGFGGMHPFPKRMGGGKTRLEVILTSLNKARGDGLDTSESSVVYAENMATARAIEEAWSTNERLGSIRDPYRITGTTIDRWETILGLSQTPNESEHDRRQRIARTFARFGQPANHQQLSDALTVVIPEIFSSISYIPLASAAIIVPDGTYPFGITATGFTWSSTVATILIELTTPTWMTDAVFYEQTARITEALDGIVPAWTVFTWYRDSSAGNAEFLLDDPHNLDNEIFD